MVQTENVPIFNTIILNENISCRLRKSQTRPHGRTPIKSGQFSHFKISSNFLIQPTSYNNKPSTNFIWKMRLLVLFTLVALFAVTLADNGSKLDKIVSRLKYFIFNHPKMIRDRS